MNVTRRVCARIVTLTLATVLLAPTVAAAAPPEPYEVVAFGGPGAFSIDADGDLLVVGHRQDYGGSWTGFALWDVSTPAAPSLEATYALPGVPWDVVLDSGLLYIAVGGGSVQVWKVSDPADAVRVDTGTIANPFRIALSGTDLFVGEWGGTVAWWDVSDPASPASVDSDVVAGNVNSLDVAGGVLAVGSRNNGNLSFFDVSGSSLVPADVVADDTFAVRLDGTTAFALGGTGDVPSVSTWDISTITEVTLLDSVERSVFGWTFDVSSGIAYVAGYGRDVNVFDGGHPADLGTLPGYYLPGRGWDVVLHNGYLYAACAGAGCGVAHLVAPDAPVIFASVAGADRYATAITSSQKAFPAGTDTVILASGANWPDALAGGALAGATDASLLLTPATSFRSDVLAEIRRLGATKAYILGGTSAVSVGVEAMLKTELGAANVDRIGGANRYETAELIGAEVGAVRPAEQWDHVAFVATGSGFADSVAASPISVAATRPLYLAAPAGLRAETLQAMQDAGVYEVFILGGPAAVSSVAEAQLKTAFGADQVERIAGANRYETAVWIALHGLDWPGFVWNGTAFATGTDFPDALAGGVLQGRKGAPILLTYGESLSAAPEGALRAWADQFGIVRYLGGTSAISQHVRGQVGAILE